MRYEVVVTPEAENDLKEIFDWYESQRIGLGHDFLLQVDAGFCLIERNPNLFVEQYKRARRYLVKRFPYIIFYRIEGENVVVLAVVFAGRDPEWIKKRTCR
ncbi:MAG: type II toxin-antitoxin system RelE/ParE family toxin [Candidatus Desantisbacteria bacterium]